MKDRIFKVMKWSGLNLSQFAEAILVSPALLSSVKSERTKPTLLLIENIKKAYPEIDINWLITGEGAMTGKDTGGLLIATEEKQQVPETTTGAEEVTKPVEKEEEEDKASAPAKPAKKREVVSVATKPEEDTEYEEEPKKEERKREPQRAVRQVLLMYNDGTYESFEK